MQKKKLSLLWLIFTVFIIAGSCCTPRTVYIEAEPPVLPDMPDTVILVEDSPVNEYRLIVLDLRWRMRDASVRRILKIITEEEYWEEMQEYDRTMVLYDEAFRRYQERMKLID